MSDARNEGIKASKGDYIVFVDSDDFIDENLVWYCLEIIEDADIAAYGWEKVEENLSMRDGKEEAGCAKDGKEDGGSAKDANKGNWDVEIFSGKEFLREFLKGGERWKQVVAWNKMYKREIWRELKFPYGKIHEDEFVIADVLLAAEKVAVSERILYCYRQREDSIMSSKNTKSYYDALEALKKRCGKVRFDEEMYGLAVCQYYNYLFSLYWLEKDREKSRYLRKEYHNLSNFAVYIRHEDWKGKTLKILFYLSPWLYKGTVNLIRLKNGLFNKCRKLKERGGLYNG